MLGKSVNNKFYAACHDTLDCQLGPMIHIVLTPALYRTLGPALGHALRDALDHALYDALRFALRPAHDAALVQLQQDLKNAR